MSKSRFSIPKIRNEISDRETRVGESGRRLMHLVPAPAVRLMKRRVQSRPGVIIG